MSINKSIRPVMYPIDGIQPRDTLSTICHYASRYETQLVRICRCCDWNSRNVRSALTT